MLHLGPERGCFVSNLGVYLNTAWFLTLVCPPAPPQAPILQFHSGYQASDLAPVARRLHAMLRAPPYDTLMAVRNKYSHE